MCYRTELRLLKHSLLPHKRRNSDKKSMLAVLKSCGFLLIFVGLLWFGHFGLIETEETPSFASETIPLPAVTPPAAGLVRAGVCAVVVGGVMVISGFWLIGRIKNSQLRTEALLNRHVPRF